MRLFLVDSIVLLVVFQIHRLVLADDPSTNDEVNLASDQIAKLRLFKAENLYVTSQDSYIINVVYIPPVNPNSKKRAVIFNHGSTQSSTYFMTNSVDARPRDLSNLDAGSMSIEELIQRFENDPIAKSMPLLLVCFGHPVYLINRRGTEFSLGKKVINENSSLASSSQSLISDASRGVSSLVDGVASTLGLDQSSQPVVSLISLIELLLKPQLNLASIPNTLDASYWSFSLDQQALYDLPAVIEFVRKRSSSDKVAYVGHSLGNALMFMLQSEQPDWANKVEPFLAWSPDLYLGHTTSILRPVLVALQPILSQLSVPFPPTPIDPLTRTLLASLCQTRLAQDTVCRALSSAMWDYSGNQQQTLPAFMASQFYSISSGEAVQLAQCSEFGKMHKYNYTSTEKNMKAYGQPVAPLYNVSNIISESISLWHGEQDALATPTDVSLLIKDLRVRVDDRYITEEPFNHYDLLFGKNASRLVHLPSLKVIESYA